MHFCSVQEVDRPVSREHSPVDLRELLALPGSVAAINGASAFACTAGSGPLDGIQDGYCACVHITCTLGSMKKWGLRDDIASRMGL